MEEIKETRTDNDDDDDDRYCFCCCSIDLTLFRHGPNATGVPSRALKCKTSSGDDEINSATNIDGILVELELWR